MLFLHQQNTISNACRCSFVRDLINSRNPSSETSVGWFCIISEIPFLLVLILLHSRPKSAGDCLLKESSTDNSSSVSSCISSFSWSLIQSNDPILLSWLFLSHSSASMTASLSGSNIALLRSTIAWTSPS